MFKNEGAPRRFAGSLSPMSSLRGIVHLDMAEGAKGSALEEITNIDVSKADDLKKVVAQLVEANNVLAKREKSGKFVSEAEWKNIDDGLKELSGKLKAAEETLAAGSAFLKNGGESFLLDKALLRLNPPDDMSKGHRAYFNVVALAFDELAGLSNMTQAQRRFVGMSETVARAYSSPGAARLRETQDRLQALNDVLLVKDILLAPSANMQGRTDLASRMERMKGYKEWSEYEKCVAEFNRSFNETTSTSGLNWVPVVLSAQMMGLVQIELKVAALFPQITMTAKTLDWTVLGADLVAYFASESTADGTDTAGAATTATINKITFTAQKAMCRSFASSEIIEDSIVPAIQFILSNMAKVLARAVEDALINGESGGSTLDGATFNAATSTKRMWKGLRFYALQSTNPAKIDMASAAPTTAKLLEVQLQMGVYGANQKAIVWIVGFRGLKRIMGMTEMITLEKFGPSATILTGQVGSLFGSPVILSEFVFDQQTTGVYGNGTARTFGSIICVYTDAFGLASRRAININASSDRYIDVDQTVFVGTMRNDFQPFFTPSATVAPVGILYDIV